MTLRRAGRRTQVGEWQHGHGIVEGSPLLVRNGRGKRLENGVLVLHRGIRRCPPHTQARDLEGLEPVACGMRPRIAENVLRQRGDASSDRPLVATHKEDGRARDPERRQTCQELLRRGLFAVELEAGDAGQPAAEHVDVERRAREWRRQLDDVHTRAASGHGSATENGGSVGGQADTANELGGGGHGRTVALVGVTTGPVIRHVRSADGVDIAWTSLGDGPALIHLPGVPFSNIEGEWRIPVMRHAFERLANDLQFVQFDGRGTGRSQRYAADLSVEAMLLDIDAVAAAAGLERFALLGFFHSVLLAIPYAARHPDRVTRLVLFGGGVRGGELMSGQGTQALLSLIERDWDTFVESITHAWLGWPGDDQGNLAADVFRSATSPGNARRTLEVARDIDVTADLGGVRCPAVVLHRREAPVIPVSLSQELADGLPNGELRLIEGRSATLFFENTDDVVDEVVSAVTGRARPAPTVSDAGPSGRLTPRELEVLRLVAAGESNGQIAARLGVSINTIERHVANLYRKIDARGRADATAYAIRQGLA
jgi:pimeloyl-ACP methyl ester carboxylesterase/DNA-binding CsgD family transcriptional regulator